jgi:hypothetical protein
MPEAPEVEIDSVHESIHETVEREGGAFLRRIALSTALLAAFAAVASLQAGATVNEALVLKMEATELQASASDQWAYYQAKGIKAAVQEAVRESWLAADKAAPARLDQTIQRYTREQEEIKKDAEDQERARDDKTKQADRLLARHHTLANAVALFQIAIALGAVAALTRARAVWLVSLLVGAGAIALFAVPLVR